MEKYKILIVDDEPANLEILSIMLQDSNRDYSVVSSNNVNSAFEIALELKPDLVITDWNMPKLTGFDLLKKLIDNNKTKDTPVVVTTGVKLSPSDLQRALDAGFVDYIRKPFNEIEILARVGAALRISQAHKQNIELKNRELAENALYLIKNKEFTSKINSKLNDLKKNQTEKMQKLDELIDFIDEKLKTDNWERFNISFLSLYENFYKNIHIKFPDLSAADLRLCALLRLGMSTKEIASVFNQNADSVKVARYRLRQKFKMIKKENLQSFLSKF